MSKSNGKHATASVTANGRKRAAVYARVSTDEQAEKGYSLPTQLEAMRKYAAEHGYTVAADAEIKDDYSGAKLDRPGLNRLREMLERHEVEAVIVYASDRLARNLAHSLLLREEFKRAGIDLHYCNRGRSEDTPESRMTENIEAVFAEYHRAKIIENCRRGMHGKAKSGKFVGNGKSPYGYTSADGHLEIYEPEAEVVRMIYRWYLTGSEDGGGPLKVYTIARKLSEIGIPTPGESRGNRRVRISGMWNQTTVNAILKCETYIGSWLFGKRIGYNGRGGKRARSEQTAVSVPPIIPGEAWEAAKARCDYNKRISRRNTKREYLLRGMVNCGCGSAMTGTSHPDGNYWYRCSSFTNRYKGLEEKHCQEKIVRGDMMESIAWDQFTMDIFADPVSFESRLRETQQQEEGATRRKREEIEILTQQARECEAEAKKLVRQLAKLPEGGLMSRTIGEKIADLEKTYEKITRGRDTLLAELESRLLSSEDIRSMLQFREDVLAGMQNPTFEDKRQVLELLQMDVAVRGKQATVKCRLPIGERMFEIGILRNAQPNQNRWIILSESFSLADSLFAGIAKKAEVMQ